MIERLRERRLRLLVDIMHHLIDSGALSFAVLRGSFLILLPLLPRAEGVLECLVASQVTLLVMNDRLFRQDVHLREHALCFGVLNLVSRAMAATRALIIRLVGLFWKLLLLLFIPPWRGTDWPLSG